MEVDRDSISTAKSNSITAEPFSTVARPKAQVFSLSHNEQAGFIPEEKYPSFLRSQGTNFWDNWDDESRKKKKKQDWDDDVSAVTEGKLVQYWTRTSQKPCGLVLASRVSQPVSS